MVCCHTQPFAWAIGCLFAKKSIEASGSLTAQVSCLTYGPHTFRLVLDDSLNTLLAVAECFASRTSYAAADCNVDSAPAQ